MIDHKELRIGNYIHGIVDDLEGDKQVLCSVDIIDNPGMTDYRVWCIDDEANEEYLRLDPIPITEEWLLKLGFISNPYEDRYQKGDFHVHCDKTKGFLDLWVTNCRLDLKYVHQLQNLYFALTGEELTIKDEEE